MWQEADHTCFYCGQPVGAAEFLNGYDVEVEHVIPRSLFFDDGFSNKVCACRKCNKEKNNRTAYDYMRSKSDGEFTAYLERIEKLYKEKKIGKTKYERLLTPADKIPTDFIDRQLRESQYIARKSREILLSVCRDVTSTSGSVTDFIRRTWGWDKVLHDLNFDRYKQAELTEIKEREHNGKKWSEEVIKAWNKRLDHRHHAIDALVIACTKQGYIQRINNMSELKDLVFAPEEKQGSEYQERKTRLEKYIHAQPHFSTDEVAKAVDSILISFKAGKKAASTGKRYVHRGGKRTLLQENIVIPRGALHEDSLYGTIARYDKRKGETKIEKQSVLKYPLSSIVRKNIEFIVDDGLKELVRQRFDNHVGNEKDVWKDLANNPLLFNGAPVRSVRCFTGLKSEATSVLDRGYVKPGNNHHIAMYVDRDGKRHESCVTFWHAVERKKCRIPVVITRPDEVWDNLPVDLPEEFLSQLPLPDWTFEVSLQQNEMFVLGLEPDEFETAMRDKNYALLGKYLYRVQSITSNDYWFRLHIETMNDKTREGGMAKKYHRLSAKGLSEMNPHKVRISLIGKISNT
jgi:CRISPR-associated endonuclease Csn1